MQCSFVSLPINLLACVEVSIAKAQDLVTCLLAYLQPKPRRIQVLTGDNPSNRLLLVCSIIVLSQSGPADNNRAHENVTFSVM